MYAELVSFFLSLGVSIIQSGQELHGKERFVADGLMTEGECQKLISLLEVRNHEVLFDVITKQCLYQLFYTL